MPLYSYRPYPPNTPLDQLPLSLSSLQEAVKVSALHLQHHGEVTTLARAAALASRLFSTKTEGVAPLVTLLEGETLGTREDTALPAPHRDDLLALADKTVEGYYLVPREA